ncbi:MAG: LCP family protein, partial [Clostridium sp.]
MGYDDETNRSGRHQSRARQPVKRPGGREPEYKRSKNPEYEGKKHKDRESQSRRQSAATKQDISGAYHTPNRKRMQKKRRKILIILIELIILISVLVFAAYSYLNKNMSMIQRLPWDPQDIKNIEISQEKQKQMKGYWTIAVFGVDSRNSSVGKGNNSDVNIICNINEDTGEIKLVSVFRDTYLNVSSKNTYNKLNAAYLQGGPEQAVKTLNKNLDIDIDDYATFNWKAVADAINILDGIDVTLSKAEFYYINAFVTETVKATGVPSQPVKHAGLVHLDGVQAVA